VKKDKGVEVLKGIFNRFILVVLATCFIVGCNDSNDMYCQDWEPIEYSSQSIFSNVNQPVSVIAGSSNMLALACHNCYQNNNTSYTETLSLIESAIEGNADLIELDISLSDEENTTFKISHESGSLGVSFTELIAQSSLINSTQLLFIELKNELISLEQVRGFLRVLKLYSSFTEQFAYMNENRFVTIRRFDSNQTLAKFKTVLNEQEFSDIKPFIKLSRLYYKKTEAQMYEEISTAHQCGFHMVELELR
jgi:hypothetical protein